MTTTNQTRRNPMAKTYLNTTAEQDSSPNTEGYRAAADGREDDPGFTGVILVIDDPESAYGGCACGCQLPTRSADADFLPGHDARYKGILQRAHQRGDEVTVVSGGLAVSGDAMSWAAKRGWQRYIDAADNRKTKIAKAAQVKEARNGGRPVGKKSSLDRLDGLKKAGRLLKQTGLFKLAAKHITGDNYAQIIELGGGFPATVKIGRWEYQGTLTGLATPKPGQQVDRFNFTYFDKKGDAHVETVADGQIVWAS